MKINFLGDSITEGAWAGLVERRYSTLVANALGAEECNFGLSGTRIAKQVKKTNNPDADVYMTRAVKMPKDAAFTFVFGGTNDFWAGSPLGELKYSNWTEEELYCVLPAIPYLLSLIKETLPNTRIVVLINSGLSKEITEGLQEACEYFDIEKVTLQNIAKICGHPSVAGMEEIKNQIVEGLKK